MCVTNILGNNNNRATARRFQAPTVPNVEPPPVDPAAAPAAPAAPMTSVPIVPKMAALTPGMAPARRIR